MAWDQLHLDSSAFLKTVEGYSFEFIVEQLTSYDKTIFIPFDRVSTMLTVQEQVNLVATSGLTIAILRTLDKKKMLGYLISKNNQELISWYNVYELISAEAANQKIH